MRTDQELTVQQAAELLNVSRAYLTDLLEAGAVAHSRVGGRCRVSAASLIEHKRRDDQLRRNAADELSVLTRGWT